ncbi:MAG TPA: hypothetical protein K8V84_23285 [Nocardiopsis listeri]|uniref:hypothetical protein n=1 Tax=Nocardiopsis listeri TaxID=53440 RepID=UPI001D3FECCC|nr:hypothetical protein [Nocardiopsis listeri]HJE61403.1 hypothetical protein [Nocardiopsis listeri]
MNIRRIAIIGVAAPALALGGPAVAMADTFESSQSHAGPSGAQSHSVSADSGGGSGGSSYEENHQWAGPDGAGSSSTSANSGGESGGALGLGVLGL